MNNIRRNLRVLRKTFFILDIVNAVIGISIILLGIIVLINIKSNIALFPILFLLAFLMNLGVALKGYLNNQKLKYIINLIASAFLLIITFIGFITTWG